MSFICLYCAKTLFQKKGCKCANPDAMRFPPLDGFVTFVVDGYTLTEEDELEARMAYFNKKGKRA